MALNLLNPQEFADFLEVREKAGDGYIMCAYGQDPKKLSEWYYSGQYSGKQLTQARKWREICKRVWDCQGLADGFLTEKHGRTINVRARNNYADWCGTKGKGTIPGKYRVPGAAVFHDNGSYISHVGFLARPVDPKKPEGDWWLVEARGVMYGVQKYKLSARSTYNRWGLMDKRFDYTAVLAKYHGGAAEPPAPKPTLGSRTLKSGSKGEDVTMLQEILLLLGYDLGASGAAKNGVDGDFGAKTTAAVKAFQAANYDLVVDGIYGAKTHAALMDALDELGDSDEPSVPTKTVYIKEPSTWNVRKGPGTNYDRLTVVRQGESFPYISTAENGWVQLEVNGTTGWVSGKCVEVK